MGIPLVGLVHVGIGSFLSMQAYFGGTFVDGTGAVVGVGLMRNVAALMSGMTFAGLLAARTTPDLRQRATRGAAEQPEPEPTQRQSPGRLTAVRVASAVVAGPVLALWAATVGTVVGWQVAQTILGVSTNAFFYMFFEMLWVRDVVGLLVKAVAFAGFAALFACHEGLRRSEGPVPTAACRAACLATAAILVVNSGWFLLFYHAGPAFGPTLLAPPAS
jgi:phospholipid/cholesterol/gamma-HCH transport system permease protein